MHPPTASSKGGAHPGDRLGWAVVDGLVYPSARDVLEAQVRGDISHNKEVQLFRLADLRKGPTWSHLRDTSIIDTATLSATSVSDAWKAWDRDRCHTVLFVPVYTTDKKKGQGQSKPAGCYA